MFSFWIVLDLRSSYTKSSVTYLGQNTTDEKRLSLSQVQSSWASIGDEAAVVSQVAENMSRQRLVDEGVDLENDNRSPLTN